MCRILDWFHIAMTFRAIEVIARRFPFLEAPDGRLMEQEVLHAKWLVWHGKSRKGIERLERMRDSLGDWPEGEWQTCIPTWIGRVGISAAINDIW